MRPPCLEGGRIPRPEGSAAYTITKEGRAVLKIVRKQLKELGVEVGK